MSFKQDFAWGAATAAYQIEGAVHAEGKGPSVWDQMCSWPGKIRMGDTGEVSCDHYHRFRKDVELMAELGLTAYRFSVSWPRVFPHGTGKANRKGLDFYRRLVDILLEHGIQPWVTLFHWDYPLALQLRGGWLNPDSPEWFAAYATTLASKLGDRVQHWITLNEPQMFVHLGHETGVHAPGLKLCKEDLVRVNHHVVLAHGLAVQALRSGCVLPGRIGWAPACPVHAVDPEYESDPEVVAAVRHSLFDLPDPTDFASSAATWSDPIHLGRYPECFLAAYEKVLPSRWQADLRIASQPLDFFGINVYSAWKYITRSASGQIVERTHTQYEKGHARTLFDWPMTPEALYWGPRLYQERYHLPIVITENGMSGHDWVHLDGKVHDPHRIDFTCRYLRELHRAAADGVVIDGYFHWSFLDNFEWAEGYRHRFGLVYVDFNTLERIPKDSAFWYREVIQSQGRSLYAETGSDLATGVPATQTAPM